MLHLWILAILTIGLALIALGILFTEPDLFFEFVIESIVSLLLGNEMFG